MESIRLKVFSIRSNQLEFTKGFADLLDIFAFIIHESRFLFIFQATSFNLSLKKGLLSHRRNYESFAVIFGCLDYVYSATVILQFERVNFLL